DVANLSTRIIVLLGAAISVGLVASAQERGAPAGGGAHQRAGGGGTGARERERRRVAALTRVAGERDRYIRNVMESLREGLIGLDREGRITAWNPTMERWCGVAERDLAGRTLFDVTPHLQRETLAEPLQRLLRGAIHGL